MVSGYSSLFATIATGAGLVAVGLLQWHSQEKQTSRVDLLAGNVEDLRRDMRRDLETVVDRMAGTEKNVNFGFCDRT